MFSVSKNEKEVISNLGSLIEKIANESIAARDKFFIGFSGEIFKNLTFILMEISHDSITFTFQVEV